MNEHERIELQRLGFQAGALGNEIKFTPSRRRRRSAGVSWSRVAVAVGIGVLVGFFVLMVWLMPWGSTAQFVGFPSLASCLPLTAVGATPPCVLCGSTESCGCDLGALCDRSSSRFQADLVERRERSRDRQLPTGFCVVWPTESQVS